MDEETGMTPSANERPYVLMLAAEDPQHVLRGVLKWIERVDVDHLLQWDVEMLETNGDNDNEIESSIKETVTLRRLLDVQVIELIVTGRRGSAAVFQIMVRDGSSVDLLGRGVPPSPFELGARYSFGDPANYYWT